jgi:hypothetical protein
VEVDAAARPVQKLRWYSARLRAMTPAEIAWRGATEVRARLPAARAAAPRWGSGGFAELLDVLAATRRADLGREAAGLAAGLVELWGRRTRFEGDWRAHPAGGRWPEDGAWRSWRLDPKAIWELHRHQHVLALAAGGEPEQRALAADLLAGWARAERPGGGGPGWTSPYETAHRLFAWPFVLARPDELERATVSALAAAYAEQHTFVERRPSRFSSANNHRLAELVGLLAASLATNDALRWRDALRELEVEAERQTCSDGGSREQAGGYFLYVLEILWGAMLLGLAAGRSSARIRGVLQRMLEWHAAVADARGELPSFGDDAEDRWLRLPYFEPRSASALAYRVASALDGEPTLATGSAPAAPTASRLLRDSGYAVLRSGGLRALFDVGGLGYGALAAHGHADALSLVADLDGEPLLLDSGTGSYLPSQHRAYFRGTAAHNTVVVNGDDQAEQLGPHLWGDRYRVELEEVLFADRADVVRASHDGYRRRHGALHTRTVCLVRPGTIVVIDRVHADRRVACDLRWHVSADAAPELIVHAPDDAVASVEDSRRSVRYDTLSTAPCRQWRAVGDDVVFTTVVATSGAPDVRVERTRDAVVVHASGTRVVAPWNAAPEVQ